MFYLAHVCRIQAKRDPSVPKYLGISSISGLVAEYIVAIDVTRVRFPADAYLRALMAVIE